MNAQPPSPDQATLRLHGWIPLNGDRWRSPLTGRECSESSAIMLCSIKPAAKRIKRRTSAGFAE